MRPEIISSDGIRLEMLNANFYTVKRIGSICEDFERKKIFPISDSVSSLALFIYSDNFSLGSRP